MMESVQLDKYGLLLEESDPAQREVILATKHELKRYFIDTLAKLEHMISKTPDGERELRKSGFNRHDLERNIVPVISRGVNSVHSKFPGANSISFRDAHMKELNCRKTVVCEKTDGVRFFLCELLRRLPNNQVQSYWLLVDRMYAVRQVVLKYDSPSPLPHLPSAQQ